MNISFLIKLTNFFVKYIDSGSACIAYCIILLIVLYLTASFTTYPSNKVIPIKYSIYTMEHIVVVASVISSIAATNPSTRTPPTEIFPNE